MPRGGKRPGAGAPRGNFNGIKSGKHSKRMLAVYIALVHHPDKQALARDLLEHGFLVPPRMHFNKDVRGVVTYLWNKWFDRIPATQSVTASPKRNSAPRSALPEFDASPQTGENENA